jgi:hypothetical protein
MAYSIPNRGDKISICTADLAAWISRWQELSPLRTATSPGTHGPGRAVKVSDSGVIGGLK